MKINKSQNCITKKSFQEIYKVTNDHCPICGQKFIFFHPIYTCDNKAYCLNCVKNLKMF